MNFRPWIYLPQNVIFGNDKGNFDLKMWSQATKGVSSSWNKDSHESICLGYGVWNKDCNRSRNWNNT